MPAQVHILAGPARSGKTAVLLTRYRKILAGQGSGNISAAALWLVPTRHAAAEIRGRILDGQLTGCFNPGVHTFEQFAQTLLLSADKPPRYLGQLLKRQFIQRLIGKAMAAQQLKYFAPIADTAGLVDLIGGVISDLKRQEVSPEKLLQLATAADGSEKTREIAALYAEYQRLLDQHHMYDVEGRFSAAGKLLRETPPEQWAPFNHVQHLVLDGFTDFTRSQCEVLQLLATKHSALRELIITLPLEQEAGRADLFSKPQVTRQQLEARLPKVTIQWQPRPATSDWPALAHVERLLFANPRDMKPAADTQRIELIASSGEKAEIELLARRIKDLLVKGESKHSSETSGPQPAVRPGDIAVVFRSLEPVAALVKEVFTEYGIPLAVDMPPKLIRSPLLQALLSVLRLQAANWPFRQLLAVVGNNYFQPVLPVWQQTAAAADTEWAIRQLQLPSGRKELLSALQWWAKSGQSAPQATAEGDPADDADSARQAEHRQRYATAHKVLSQFEKSLPAVDKPRLVSEWIGILEGVIDHLGMLRGTTDSADNNPSPIAGAQSLSDYDTPAWQRLKNVLAAANQLEETLEEEPASLTLSEFIGYLQDVLSIEALPMNLDVTGRVRVLAAPSIRAITVPYLFVAGLAEKMFPPPVRDDYVYTETEYQNLNQAGLNFVDHRRRAGEEMLLFYEVVTRATRQLVLSYPALDEAAQPLSPSPYVTELEHCLNLRPVQDISLSPVPQHPHPYSPTELRVKAVAEWLDDRPQRLATLLGASMNGVASKTSGANGDQAASSASILAALQSIAARRSYEKFGPFEGLLLGNSAKQLLQNRFGPEHCWSVSRLEEYASCPYKFFAHRVLALEELPELQLGIDYGWRGLFAHDALAMLHRRLVRADKGLSPADVSAEEYRRLADETLEILTEQISQGSPLEIALHTVDLQLIGQWLQAYLAQHGDYDQSSASVESAADQPLRPAHFEVSFGLKPREGPEIDHQLSTDQPFQLSCGEETIRLSGRIDRIDIGMVDGQVVFNVLDYKTGSNKKFKLQDFQSGVALQLPLYALAVQDLLMVDRRAVPWRVGYWYLKEQGFNSHGVPQLFELGATGLRETAEWQSLRGDIVARVLALVQGVRGGQFPVFSVKDDCTNHCEFSTVCRVNQIRSVGKVWSGAALVAPLGTVGAPL